MGLLHLPGQFKRYTEGSESIYVTRLIVISVYYLIANICLTPFPNDVKVQVQTHSSGSPNAPNLDPHWGSVPPYCWTWTCTSGPVRVRPRSTRSGPQTVGVTTVWHFLSHCLCLCLFFLYSILTLDLCYICTIFTNVYSHSEVLWTLSFHMFPSFITCIRYSHVIQFHMPVIITCL